MEEKSKMEDLNPNPTGQGRNGRLQIVISTGTIVKIVAVLLLVWLLFILRDLVLIIFTSIVLAAIIEPIIDALERRRIPRGISVLGLYLILLAVITLIIIALIPPLINEAGQLASQFGSYWQSIMERAAALKELSARYGLLENFQKSIEAIQNVFSAALARIFSTITGVLGGIVAFFLVLVLSYYLAVEKDSVRNLFKAVIPIRYQSRIGPMLEKMQKAMGQWLIAQIILGVVIGLITYIGLLILGVNYALILAIIAAFTEFIPYAGPVIAAVPAVFFASVQSPIKGLLVIVLYAVIQRVENIILVPKIMQKVTGLNPVLAILAIAIGFELAGILGALIAIPTAMALGIFLKEYFANHPIK